MISLANLPLRESLLGKGFAYPLKTATSGDVASVKEEENVQQCLGLLFDVMVGERVMMEDFGIDAEEMLFDNADTVRDLMPLKIAEAVKLCEQRVGSVSTTGGGEGTDVKVNIRYKIKAIGLSQQTTWDPKSMGRK